MWRPDGLEKDRFRAHIPKMEKLTITADALRRIIDTDDAAATMVAERRIEELFAVERAQIQPPP